MKSFSLAINLFPPAPPPPPLRKNCFSELPIILSVCQFEISARIKLNSAIIVGLSFLGCLEQSFPEGINKPYEGTILTSGKVCCVQYLLVFRLILGYTGERLIPGLRRKDWILRALLLAVTSLWPHKVGSRVEIYSARWKFMLISDQAGKELVKKLCGRRGFYVSFSTAGLHPGS